MGNASVDYPGEPSPSGDVTRCYEDLTQRYPGRFRDETYITLALARDTESGSLGRALPIDAPLGCDR
jgi:hypothetical protein